MNEVPEYRGYANLGTGQYLLNISAKGDEPDLIISVATEQEKSGRTVGDLRDNVPGAILQPDAMAVRLRFQNVAGLDALEQQLRILRDEHFATTKGRTMTDKAELLRLAESVEAAYHYSDPEDHQQCDDLRESATILRKLAEQPICRLDGRCQYAIDSGAEGMGHCPKGKCVMPLYAAPVPKE